MGWFFRSASKCPFVDGEADSNILDEVTAHTKDALAFLPKYREHVDKALAGIEQAEQYAAVFIPDDISDLDGWYKAINAAGQVRELGPATRAWIQRDLQKSLPYVSGYLRELRAWVQETENAMQQSVTDEQFALVTELSAQIVSVLTQLKALEDDLALPGANDPDPANNLITKYMFEMQKDGHLAKLIEDGDLKKAVTAVARARKNSSAGKIVNHALDEYHAIFAHQLGIINATSMNSPANNDRRQVAAQFLISRGSEVLQPAQQVLLNTLGIKGQKSPLTVAQLREQMAA